MATTIYSCANCGVGGELELVECNICHRTFCSECITDEGKCVPCEKAQK